MIDNLKDLEKLLKLCRKQGVQEIDLGTISFKLGDIPRDQEKMIPAFEQEEIVDPYANFPQGMLSQEQLIYYSSGGDPGSDPENKQ